MIADEAEPPPLRLGQHDQLVQRTSGEHAGLVDDHCRGGRELVPHASELERALTRSFKVVEPGVDPGTFRFSGGRSAD
jgi:hypothetical protein